MSGGATTTAIVAYLEIFHFDPVAIEFVFPKRAVARIGRQVLPIAVGAPAFVRALDLRVGENGRLRFGVALARATHKTMDLFLVRSSAACADARLSSASNVGMSPSAPLVAEGDAFLLSGGKNLASATANHHGAPDEAFGPGSRLRVPDVKENRRGS